MFQTAFENITRRLDINPATRDTTNDKERGKGRAIGKVPLTIEAYPAGDATSIAPIIPSSYRKRPYMQYNCTVPREFRILGYTLYNLSATFNNFVISIRSRVGGVVTRYHLAPLAPGSALNGQSEIYRYNSWVSSTGPFTVQAPLYTNQRIGPNFTLEWWASASSFNRLIGIKILTNLLELPSSVDEEVNDTNATAVKLLRTEMELTLPLTMPVSFGAAAGVTN